MKSYARCVLASAVWLATLLACLPCRAEGELIVVIEPEQSLTAALRTSLSSWRVQVQRLSDHKVPIADDDTSMHAVATAEQAGAVVWLAGHSGDATLRIHVNAPEQTVSRVSHDVWPLEAAAAAAMALTVKTVLRNTSLAPIAERAPDPDPGPERSLTAKPEPASPEPLANVRSPVVEAEGVNAQPRSALPRLRAEVHAGLRSRIADRAGLAPELAAALAFYEPWLSAGRFGIFVEASQTVPTSTTEDTLRAKLSAQDFLIGTRWRWPVFDRFRVEMALGGGVQRTKLVGRARSTGESFDDKRNHARGSASLGLEIELDRYWVVTPRVACDAISRTQRYFGIGTDPVLESRRVAVRGTLSLGLVWP